MSAYAYAVKIRPRPRPRAADTWQAECHAHTPGVPLGFAGTLAECHDWATIHAATCSDLHWANLAAACPSCRRYGRIAPACPVCLGRGHIVERTAS